jgi:hypothetical protein
VGCAAVQVSGSRPLELGLRAVTVKTGTVWHGGLRVKPSTPPAGTCAPFHCGEGAGRLPWSVDPGTPATLKLPLGRE